MKKVLSLKILVIAVSLFIFSCTSSFASAAVTTLKPIKTYKFGEEKYGIGTEIMYHFFGRDNYFYSYYTLGNREGREVIRVFDKSNPASLKQTARYERTAIQTYPLLYQDYIINRTLTNLTPEERDPTKVKIQTKLIISQADNYTVSSYIIDKEFSPVDVIIKGEYVYIAGQSVS